MFNDIIIQPVGVVRSPYAGAACSPPPGSGLGFQAEIEIFSPYMEALLRLEENSHLWILAWFHQARRNILSTVPGRIDASLPKFGVFALRSPVRPNPVGLSLVHLDKVDGNKLQVTGLDAIDGTPVIDIKPYFENDIVFSPRTPNIRSPRRQNYEKFLLKMALAHHQEKCPDMYLAVRMALLAAENLGQLNLPDLCLTVEGSACLADVLQGLTRARLANPPRFSYRPTAYSRRSLWRKGERTLNITARRQINGDNFWQIPDEVLFEVSGNAQPDDQELSLLKLGNS